MNKTNILFFFSIFLFSCTKDKAVEVVNISNNNTNNNSGLTYCDTVTVSFVNQIKPIFIQSCATSGCHNSASAVYGYVLEDYSQISDSITFTKSLKTIKHESGVSPMPKNQPKLNDSLIQQLECWLSQGKLNN